MSTRVSATAKMTAACQELLHQRLQIPLAATAELASLRTMMLTGRAEMPALRQMIGSETVRATLGALAPAAFGRACNALTATGASGAASAVLAASAQSELTDAVSTAEAVIADAARALTADAFVDAGAELGYSVSVCAGARTTGVELRRGHELILSVGTTVGVVALVLPLAFTLRRTETPAPFPNTGYSVSISSTSPRRARMSRIRCRERIPSEL